MIPVFRCIVIETLISQYCGMFSAAGVRRYIRFRELRPLEAWECHQARKSGKIVINGRTLEGKIGATALHSMYLAADSMTRAGARSASSLSLMARRWTARQHKGCMRLRSERNLQD
jgi:hypothetical protein